MKYCILNEKVLTVLTVTKLYIEVDLNVCKNLTSFKVLKQMFKCILLRSVAYVPKNNLNIFNQKYIQNTGLFPSWSLKNWKIWFWISSSTFLLIICFWISFKTVNNVHTECYNKKRYLLINIIEIDQSFNKIALHKFLPKINVKLKVFVNLFICNTIFLNLHCNSENQFTIELTILQ